MSPIRRQSGRRVKVRKFCRPEDAENVKRNLRDALGLGLVSALLVAAGSVAR